MSLAGLTLLAAITLNLAPTPGVDPAQVVADFRHLCIDTHADAAKAFALADAQGWKPAPDKASTFWALSGNHDGRTIAPGTADYRLLALSPPASERRATTCVIIGGADFARTAAALGAAIGQPPDTQTDKAWNWELLSTETGFQPLSKFAPAQFAQLSLKDPMVTIRVLPASPTGVGLAFKESTVLLAPLAKPLPADAGDVTHFKAWIEQGGRRFPLEGEIHLKPAPFTIVLQGSHVFDYTAISSQDDHLLAGRSSQADLQAVFNRFGSGAEGNRDGDLFLNPPGKPRGDVYTNQYWAENDRTHRFSSYFIDAKGVATARKQINDVMLIGLEHGDPGAAPVPMTAWTGGPIYMLITARPPLDGAPHVDPKYAVLMFN